LKKVVLRPDFVAKAQGPMDLFEQLLFEALSYHDLKKHFECKIDYKKWEEILGQKPPEMSGLPRREESIPLLEE